MFKTKDLCLAATLESVAIQVIKMTISQKGSKKEATFWFEESPELDIAVGKYWKRGLRVEPREYFTNLKGLKSRIYEME